MDPKNRQQNSSSRSWTSVKESCSFALSFDRLYLKTMVENFPKQLILPRRLQLFQDDKGIYFFFILAFAKFTVKQWQKNSNFANFLMIWPTTRNHIGQTLYLKFRQSTLRISGITNRKQWPLQRPWTVKANPYSPKGLQSSRSMMIKWWPYLLQEGMLQHQRELQPPTRTYPPADFQTIQKELRQDRSQEIWPLRKL